MRLKALVVIVNYHVLAKYIIMKLKVLILTFYMNDKHYLLIM